jgi:hypothetical protein
MINSVIKLNEKLELEGKIVLESLYSGYISGLMINYDDDKFTDMILGLVDFRLDVSGGEDSDFGIIGMNYVSSFFDEVELILNMVDDYEGQYRGDYKYENLDEFKLCLNNLEFDLLGDEETINEDDKVLLLNEFKIRFNIED